MLVENRRKILLARAGYLCLSGQEKGTAADDVDRISRLPDHIIHRILSFLPTTDVVRVSVWSKAWYSLFTSFPMTTFSPCPRYGKPYPMIKFAEFVYNSLLRQCQQNSRITKFGLSIREEYYSSDDVENLTYRCIQLATQNGVMELELDFKNTFNDLSLAMFSTKELAVCRLINCSLGGNFPCWPSLRELYLVGVTIKDKKVMDDLNFVCPFVEKLALKYCYGLNNLRLSGFTKLEEVKIEYSWTIKKIEIDSLSLQTFSFSDRNNYNRSQFALTSCKNLEVLELKFSFIEDSMGIQELITELPSLKVLILEASEFTRIKISSQQLEKLRLSSTNMVETIINARRLQSFKNGTGKFPSSFKYGTGKFRPL